jgi:beta-lactamase superfamily II metal-dependent hydrolase
MSKERPPLAVEPKGTLLPPKGGATVRMYRIGHGDCFLLAFDGDLRPVYVLIDCGYKPGSPAHLGTTPDDVVADIKVATGGHIDVAVITHEHQDHVNAITMRRFDGITVGEAWFAWTENESDPLARALRRKHRDTLKALTEARLRLAASDPSMTRRIGEFMALEIGGEDPAPPSGIGFAANGQWTNKDSMKLFRDRSQREPRCIYPHKEIIALPGAGRIRVFALGPPHDQDALEDLDPHGSENFSRHGLGGGGTPASFSAAVLREGGDPGRPFPPRQTVPIDRLAEQDDLRLWYARHYDSDHDVAEALTTEADEVVDNAVFRRIENDWLLSAEQLALAMGNDTNNSSLVLAFEIGRGGKVLLFAGDAQRGNWARWAAKPFRDGDAEVEVRELLGRTVLYKVGHHGSHNATLKGHASDPTPNLAWLGQGQYAGEFTAMIPAVRAWAMQPNIGWDHPLAAIKAALVEKCAGRVFQTDTNLEAMTVTASSSGRAWASFQSRARDEHLYFNYEVLPDPP